MRRVQLLVTINYYRTAQRRDLTNKRESASAEEKCISVSRLSSPRQSVTYFADGIFLGAAL